MPIKETNTQRKRRKALEKTDRPIQRTGYFSPVFGQLMQRHEHFVAPAPKEMTAKEFEAITGVIAEDHAEFADTQPQSRD